MIWETYSKWGGVAYQFILCLNLIMAFVYLINQKLDYKKLFIAALFIVFFIFISFHTYNNQINYGFGSIVLMLLIVLFLQINDIDQKEVFKVFSFIFMLAVIPAIIYWIGEELLNIKFSYGIIYPINSIKNSGGTLYKHFFGAIIAINKNYIIDTPRLCGVFDEPGVIGTVAALLLVGDKLDLKKNKKNIIIFVAGVLSFSLTFFVLIVIYYTIKNITKSPKKIIIFAFTIITCLFLISTYGVKNELLNRYIFSRLEIQNGEISGNNRTSDSFDYIYNNFLNSGDLKDIFFGKGTDAANNNIWMIGSSSYKKLIYDFGIIGSFYSLIFILCIIPIKYKEPNKDMIIFVLIFVFSIYQRPYVMNLQYLVILLGGISNLYLTINEKEEKDSQSFKIYE